MPEWLNTTLLGLGTVFFGLICLIFITKLMSAIIVAGEKKKQPAASAPVAAVASEQDAIPDRGAFVAAVSSALATVMGTEVSGLRIHSIKKVK